MNGSPVNSRSRTDRHRNHEPQDQWLAHFVEHQDRNCQHYQKTQGKLFAETCLRFSRAFELATPFHRVAFGKPNGFDIRADTAKGLICCQVAACTAEDRYRTLTVAAVDKGLDEAGLKAGDEVGHRHIADSVEKILFASAEMALSNPARAPF